MFTLVNLHQYHFKQATTVVLLYFICTLSSLHRLELSSVSLYGR